MIFLYIRGMNYKYRVTLTGIKGFFRVYSVNADNSLYTFHKQLRDDLEFPLDQPILFKALDAEGNVLARYALIDLGFGTVDNISIARTVKEGAVSFVYFYDIKGKKSVNITLEGECSEGGLSPVILEVKGPNPIEFENGYVAFEDLPDEKRHLPGEKHRLPGPDDNPDDLEEDDEDDEDDEDEDDDEKEDVIYDEKEEL